MMLVIGYPVRCDGACSHCYMRLGVARYFIDIPHYCDCLLPHAQMTIISPIVGFFFYTNVQDNDLAWGNETTYLQKQPYCTNERTYLILLSLCVSSNMILT